MFRLSITLPTLGRSTAAKPMWLDILNQKRHTAPMEAGVRELRDRLSHYLNVVRAGQEVTVTDHGKAVARLVPLDQPRALDRLVAEGLVTPAPAAKRSRTPLRITAKGTVSDLVAEQRQ
jgi:prevent-host-death family protein